MGALQIPESVQVGLRLFQRLEQPVVEQLYVALKAEPPRIAARHLIDSVSTKISAVPKEELNKIILAMLSLHSGLRTTKLSQADFLQAVVDSEELAVSADQKSAFKDRLSHSLE